MGNVTGKHARGQDGVQFHRHDIAGDVGALFTKFGADILDFIPQLLAVRASSREQDSEASSPPGNASDIMGRQVDGLAEGQLPLVLELLGRDGDGVNCSAVVVVVHQVGIEPVRVLEINDSFGIEEGEQKCRLDHMPPVLGKPLRVLGHELVDTMANADLPELVTSSDACIHRQKATW